MAHTERAAQTVAAALLAISSAALCQLQWTQVAGVPTSGFLSDVVWTGSQFVAVGDSGVALTSTDGAAWTLQQTGTREPLYGVACTDSMLVALGHAGTILTSADGVSWAPRSSACTHNLCAAAWSGALLVAVGLDMSVFPYQGTVLTTADGITWTIRATDTAAAFGAILYTGTEFVAVGSNYTYATYATSPDGLVWTSHPDTTVSAMKLNGLAASDSQIVAVGTYGSIVSSRDGITWTERNSGLPAGAYSTLGSVTWTGSEFVAVGLAHVVTSPDGINWSQVGSGSHALLSGVTHNGSLLVAVGQEGHILTSPVTTAVRHQQPQTSSSARVSGIRVSPQGLAFALYLSEAGIVRGSLHDLCGHTVASFVTERLAAGTQSVVARVPCLSPGNYLLRVSTGDQRVSHLVSVY